MLIKELEKLSSFDEIYDKNQLEQYSIKNLIFIFKKKVLIDELFNNIYFNREDLIKNILSYDKKIIKIKQKNCQNMEFLTAELKFELIEIENYKKILFNRRVRKFTN